MEFTGKKEATILTKSLPPAATSCLPRPSFRPQRRAAIRAAAVCELLDGGPGAIVDTAGWDTELVQELPSGFIGETTLSLEAAVTFKATTTVSLVCTDRSPDKEGQKIGAAFSQIVAVQTSQNG